MDERALFKKKSLKGLVYFIAQCSLYKDLLGLQPSFAFTLGCTVMEWELPAVVGV